VSGSGKPPSGDEQILFEDHPLDGVDPEALHPSYRAVLEALNRSRAPYVLIGAVAVALIGGERLTRDIDAMCTDAAVAIRALYEAGFRVVSRAVPAEPGAFVAFATSDAAIAAVSAKSARIVRAIHSGNARLRFDVWFETPAPGLVSTESLLANAVPVRLGSLETLRACADDVIELKRFAMAKSPDRAAKDLPDIEVLERFIAGHGSERR
jgi:hypothetical protein